MRDKIGEEVGMLRALLGPALVVCALVLSCGAAAQPIDVTVPPPMKAAPLGAISQPVSLTRLAANIASGTPWRQDVQSPYFMVPCAVTTEMKRWTEADNRITDLRVFDRIFRDVLERAGFRGGGDPTNLFEEQTGSDLQVGALVTALRMKTCTFVGLGKVSFSGSAVMDIEWQVYSVSQSRILARIATHGGFEFKATNAPYVTAEDQDTSPILRGAFADSVQRLAANEEFRRIASAAPQSSPSGKPSGRLSFVGRSSPTPMAEAVRSVVTIYAGDAAGSGVVISPDGYVLTNHHVAGSSGQLRVHWADGTDSIGEVVRSDVRRDVALIRTTPKAGPLAIRYTPARLGETVFAIGTPLRKEFSNTLTRGVVSGTRLMDGLPLIQSDVAIDHGNSGGPLLDEEGRIIALTVSRYEQDGVGHSINFFIPIEDALEALALEPQVAPEPQPKLAPRK